MSVRSNIDIAQANNPVGVGLKAQHYIEVLETKPDLGFFEVHAENYMMQGGNHLRFLEAISELYPLSIHGVGMSLGSAEGLDAEHLAKFKKLVDRFKPALVSEHLAWSVQGGTYLNDLLPLPLNDESLRVVSDNVSRMQDAIGQQILVENPSTYIAFGSTDIDEPDYLGRLAQNTGCGLILDINNVYVSATNNGFSAEKYLGAFPLEHVGEIHMAGHTEKDIDGAILRIDDHGSPVIDPVWALFEAVVNKVDIIPTLIEWDNDIPEFDVLLGEAAKARAILNSAKDGVEVLHGAA